MELVEILEAFLYPGVLYISILALLFEWIDRKLVARFQNRVGPYYAGPHGSLQPLADFIKLLSKEDIVPANSDKLLFTMGPVLALVIPFLGTAFLPISHTDGLVSIEGDLIVVVALLTLYALIVYVSGVAPPSRYSLIGAERTVLMLVGFEIPLILSCLSAAISAGSLRISRIVEYQAGRWLLLGPHLVGFIIFLVAAQAELERIPFDLPEAEKEIVAGWQVEYASWRLAFFRLSRDVEHVLLAGLAAALFLGGPLGPAPPGFEHVLYPAYFLAKSIAVLALFSLLKASFARIRIDQFVDFCWHYLIPISLAYLMAIRLVT